MNLQIHLQQRVMLTTPGLVSPAEAGREARIMLLWLTQPKFNCAKPPQCGLASTESGHSLSYGLDGLDPMWKTKHLSALWGLKTECIPVEKLVHLVRKRGLPVPLSPLREREKPKKGASHQPYLTCI